MQQHNGQMDEHELRMKENKVLDDYIFNLPTRVTPEQKFQCPRCGQNSVCIMFHPSGDAVSAICGVHKCVIYARRLPKISDLEKNASAEELGEMAQFIEHMRHNIDGQTYDGPWWYEGALKFAFLCGLHYERIKQTVEV